MTSAPRPPSTHGLVRHDIVLRLLDHQIVGPEGELLGNVDDVELLDTDAGLLVTGIAVGPAALAQRMPGRMGDWLHAVWRRLHPDEDPEAVVVPVEHIARLGSAVEVDPYAAEALAEGFGLEQWLRTFVVSRIPGAKGGGDERAGSGAAPQAPAREASHGSRDTDGSEWSDWRPRPGARFLSSLIGRTVVDATGDELGRICEVHCVGRPPGGPQAAMTVTHLQYGRHQRGSELGYTSDREQGPWIVAALLQRWQRDNRVVPVTSVDGLGDSEGPITVPDPETLRHPYRFVDR